MESILGRDKFGFQPEDVERMINVITTYGVVSYRKLTDVFFNDIDDIVFYEVALSKEGAYVVTGNVKDFPRTPIVVTPAEMIQILEDNGLIEKEE